MAGKRKHGPECKDVVVEEAKPAILQGIINYNENILSGIPRFLRNAVEGRGVTEEETARCKMQNGKCKGRG